MEYVNGKSAVKHTSSPSCIVYEYPMQNSEMNIALAEITHRYPNEGYAVNDKCSEMGYILKGSGKLGRIDIQLITQIRVLSGSVEKGIRGTILIQYGPLIPFSTEPEIISNLGII